MNLSSKTTFVFPFILLLIPSFYFVYIFFGIDPYMDDMNDYLMVFPKSAAVAAVLYFALRASVDLFSKNKFIQYLLIIFPNIVFIILTRYPHIEILSIFAGLFLFAAFKSFLNRYTGVLTQDTIDYQNLFGQTGQVHLKDIVKLEQKKNLLSVFQSFKILDVSRRTGITFADENLDEYEIDIFTKAFKAEELFSAIIDRANQCGNQRIRQYTV